MGIGGIIGNLFAGGVGDVVEKVGNAIHQNVTSDKERMALENEAKKAEQDFSIRLAEMDTDLAKGQQAVNMEEAKNPHLFVAGWRPFIGWLCGITIGIMFIPKCLVITSFWSYKVYLSLSGHAANLPDLPPFPDMGSGEIMGLVSAMLGLGGLRTWEKVKGVESTGVRVFNK
jgi:Holin of 3TMs, for gene-transfer release